MIYRLNPNLSNAVQIQDLNEMVLELNGKLAQAVFTELDVTDLYSRTLGTRKYLRGQNIGNTISTYTGWTHLKAQSGYSIWKFSPTNYLYDANNTIYMNNKVFEFKGLAGSETATTFNKVFWLNEESGNTYHDYTSVASVEGGTGFPVMNSTPDYLYIGLSTTFAGARFEWQTRGSNYTLYIEYWNGSNWIQLTSLVNNLIDDTNNFQSDGHISWTIPGTWALNTIDGQNKYWIRFSTTTTPVTTGQCNYLIPSNSVIGLLGLSFTDIQEENWAWCSYASSIYVTIRNSGNPAYEGNYYITSTSSSNNLQNFFVVNNPFTGDYGDSTYNPSDFASNWGFIGGTLSDQTDLQNALNAKLTDAPSDGNTYGRKNGTWTSISVTWGNITGTLSSQTDLQSALNNKYNASNPSGYQTAANVTTTLTGYSVITHNHNDLYYGKPTVTTLLNAKADIVHSHNLENLYDVRSNSGLTNGDVLTWNAGAGVWHNAPVVVSATVTRGTFTNGSLASSILTVTHNKGLSAPYSMLIEIYDNNNLKIIPDNITGATNTTLIDLTSYGTISGTWGYAYV